MKSLLNASILYLVLALWALYRLWTGLQVENWTAVLLWGAFAVLAVVLYILENFVKKKKR